MIAAILHKLELRALVLSVVVLVGIAAVVFVPGAAKATIVLRTTPECQMSPDVFRDYQTDYPAIAVEMTSSGCRCGDDLEQFRVDRLTQRAALLVSEGPDRLAQVKACAFKHFIHVSCGPCDLQESAHKSIGSRPKDARRPRESLQFGEDARVQDSFIREWGGDSVFIIHGPWKVDKIGYAK